nr:hypothetical protein [Frankiales bacterium]
MTTDAFLSHDGAVTRWRIRDRIRRLPAGEVIVHGAVFLLGAAFIATGLAFIVLPGPLTIPPILIGLAIWSLEFDFAQSLLDRAKGQAQKAWDEARAHPWRTGLITGGGLVLAVAVAVLASRYGLVQHARDVLT